jgi:hypothetical protein
MIGFPEPLGQTTNDLPIVSLVVRHELSPRHNACSIPGFDSIAFAWEARQLDVVNILPTRSLDGQGEVLHRLAGR